MFRPFFVSLFSVPSLHIQLYSCCLSQVSLFGSSLGACGSMFSVILLLSLCCFRWLCIELCSFVRCSMGRILIGLCVYPTYSALHDLSSQVSR